MRVCVGHNRGFSPALFLRLILIACLFGCGGLTKEEPVNLPVPFSGALTSESRVVVVDGTPAGSGSLLRSSKLQQALPACSGKGFSAFDSQGKRVGSCFYDESRISLIEGGAPGSFAMPVCCVIDSGDTVRAEKTEFFELPHEDPSKNLCALLPAGEDCSGARLVRGAASGIISSGTGNFAGAVNLMTIEHRYAAVVKGEGLSRRAFNLLEGVWILNRPGSGTP